jgi:hypothetical protein
MNDAPSLSPRTPVRTRRIICEGFVARGRALRDTSPLGGCHALKLDDVIVRTHFPQLKGAPS